MLGQHFIYAIGGDGDNGFLNDIEFYNIIQNRWFLVNIANNHFYRSLCFCYQLSEHTILIGGGCNDQGYQKDSYILETHMNSIVSTGDLPCGMKFINT